MQLSNQKNPRVIATGPSLPCYREQNTTGYEGYTEGMPPDFIMPHSMLVKLC